MIVTWMLGAILVSTLVGAAARAAEGAMRALGHARRWSWLFALAAATAWPLIAGAAFLVRANQSHRPPVVTVRAASAVRAVAARMPALDASRDATLGRAVVAFWVLASLVLLARLLVGLARLRRVGASGTTHDVDGLRVVVTDSLGPAVYGALRPRIVVPRWLLDLEPPLRALVLSHEEQHRARGDAAVIVASALATALVPWNPAVWWINRRLRLAVELDCDSRVVATTGDVGRYSKLLLLIAQRQSHATLVPMLAESNAHLGRRIAEMNSPRTSRSYARAAAFGAVALGIVAVACSRQVMSDVTAPEPISASKLRGLPQDEKVFFEFQVQKPATEAPNTTRPRYPNRLKDAGVEGEVIAQFVVDETGRPLTGSLKIVKASHEMFANAVRAALPGMKFTPAEVDGRKVRQLVQQPFVFAMARSKTDTTTAAPARTKSGILQIGPVHVTPASKRP